MLSWVLSELRTPLCQLSGMPTERARRSELAQFVADHVFGDKHWNVFSAVMDGERVPYKVGRDRRAARPSFDQFPLPLRVEFDNLLHQVVVNEESFL